jgi:aspartate-semialdehyde dehydrogenase
VLTFQSVREDVFGEQAAFNLYARSRSAAKTTLDDARKRVRRDFEKIAGDEAAKAMALKFVQAPVFHGYAASIFVEVAASVDEVAKALDGDLVRVVRRQEACSLQSAVEGGSVLRFPKMVSVGCGVSATT